MIYTMERYLLDLTGFIKSESYARNLSTNPLIFEQNYMESVTFCMNGEPTPRESFRLDFIDCGCLWGLLSLYGISSKLMENTDTGVTRKRCREGYNVRVFDM